MNGGSEEFLIGEKVGDVANGSFIAGNTLVLVIRARVTVSSEYYYMDNLKVERSKTKSLPDHHPSRPLPLLLAMSSNSS